jgi:hypothetical protein
VLALYDASIGGPGSGVVLDMIGQSALLWRLALRGADVGVRWPPLALRWAPHAAACRPSWRRTHQPSSRRFGRSALRRIASAAATPSAPCWSAQGGASRVQQLVLQGSCPRRLLNHQCVSVFVPERSTACLPVRIEGLDFDEARLEQGLAAKHGVRFVGQIEHQQVFCTGRRCDGVRPAPRELEVIAGPRLSEHDAVETRVVGEGAETPETQAPFVQGGAALEVSHRSRDAQLDVRGHEGRWSMVCHVGSSAVLVDGGLRSAGSTTHDASALRPGPAGERPRRDLAVGDEESATAPFAA